MQVEYPDGDKMANALERDVTEKDFSHDDISEALQAEQETALNFINFKISQILFITAKKVSELGCEDAQVNMLYQSQQEVQCLLEARHILKRPV